MNMYRNISLLSICFLCGAANAQTFSLRQALSAPFSSDLTAAPVEGRFAWLTQQRGQRNLWIAEPDTTAGAAAGSYSSRELTHYSEDDGQEIYQIAWSPDAQSIVYVRGGDSEFLDKPAPNPSLRASGAEQDIWLISIEGGQPRKIGQGYAPVVAPRGDRVAYISAGQILIATLHGAESKPEQLLRTRGDISALTWSPDGNRLAFVSQRTDHGFIGTYDFPSQQLRYLDPSTDYDTDPVWSPGSDRVAFVRVPSTPRLFSSAGRTGVPWSLRIADVATGTGHEVWHAQPDRGSVFYDDQGGKLLWTADDHLVFPWEGDGWLHLYSVAVPGGAATELTPGTFEVEDETLSGDRKTIFYASNQGDPNRRHIWSVAASAGVPKALTQGDGIEVAPVEANGVVAILRSDAHTPIRPALLLRDGTISDFAPQLTPADYPGARFVVPRPVTLSAGDGLPIYGQLFEPSQSRGGARHPAIVFFHGGPEREMLLGFHPMHYYSNAYAMNQYLVSLGYIVLSVNYRGGIGYGLDFRQPLNYGRKGASEFNDVQGAGLYLRARSDVDPARIGVWGGSYGGYLTALALARASDMFACGVDMHGVHAWGRAAEPTTYEPDANPQAADLVWQAAPLASMATWRSPVLLIQGDDDRNVRFAQTVMLANALRKQGVEYEELIFPDEIHEFLLHRSWLAAYTAEADFFQRHLHAVAPASGRKKQ